MENIEKDKASTLDTSFNKKIKRQNFIIKVLVVIVLSSGVFAYILNDFNMYSTPIIKVTSITNSSGQQQISGVLKNTDSAGDKVTVTNSYDKSLVYDNKYHNGDYLFVNIEDKMGESNSEFANKASGNTDSNYNLQIVDQKRDYLLAIPLILLIDLLILVGGIQGSLTILGLIVNISIFLIALKYYNKGYNVLGISIILCLIFSFLVLLLVNGFNRRTLIAEITTLASTLVMGIVSFLVIDYGPDVSYDFLGFLPEPFTVSDAKLLFLAEIIIGSLGAIMDIAVTITSTASELLEKDPTISKKALMKSARDLSEDITGTMINVVFFTNIAAIIPVFIISLKNDFQLNTIFANNVPFEVARFLTGSTAIILAIPFAIFATTLFHRHHITTQGGPQ